MKRALLIAGGSIGGLGAVLAITPPQLSSTELALPAGSVGSSSDVAVNTGTASSVSSSSPTASAQATKASATSTKTTTAAKSSTSTKSANTTAKSTTATSSNTSANTNSNTSSNTTAAAQESPTPAPAKTVAKSAGVTGEFTGTAVNVGYGIMQVKIVVDNGKITDAIAVQAPSGRNARWTSMALPILKQQTLAAQSDAISGASGASYTSYGWYKSLQSALSKAGML